VNKLLSAVFVLAALVVGSPIAAQDVPEMPKPHKEHQWLKRLVGEWGTDA
jgi:hypothetical protein